MAQCLGLVDARATHMTWARVGEQQELTPFADGKTRASSVSMDGGSRRATSIDGGRRTESRTLLQPATSARSPGRDPGRGAVGGGSRGTFGGGTRGTFSDFTTPGRPVRSLRATVGSDQSDARGLLR